MPFIDNNTLTMGVFLGFLVAFQVLRARLRADNYGELLARFEDAAAAGSWCPLAAELDHSPDFKAHCIAKRQQIIRAQFLRRFPKHPRQLIAYEDSLLTLFADTRSRQMKCLGEETFVFALQHHAYGLANKLQKKLGFATHRYQKYFEFMILQALRGDSRPFREYLKKPDDNIIRFFHWVLRQKKWPDNIHDVLQFMCQSEKFLNQIHISEMVELAQKAKQQLGEQFSADLVGKIQAQQFARSRQQVASIRPIN